MLNFGMDDKEGNLDSVTTRPAKDIYFISGCGFDNADIGIAVSALCFKKTICSVIKVVNSVARYSDDRLPKMSYFSSGTPSGAETVLSEYFSIDPFAFVDEKKKLQTILIAQKLHEKMFVHYGCKLITPFHKALAQIKAACGDNSKVIQLGLKEMEEQEIENPCLTLRVKDLIDLKSLPKKLFKIRQFLLQKSIALIKKAGVRTESTDRFLYPFLNPNLINETIQTFSELKDNCWMIWGYEEFFESDVLFEAGAILDCENIGLSSKSHVADGTKNALAILKSAQIKQGMVKIGVVSGIGSDLCLSGDLFVDFVKLEYSARNIGKLDSLIILDNHLLMRSRTGYILLLPDK